MPAPYNYNVNEKGAGLLLGGTTSQAAPPGQDYPVWGTGSNQGVLVSRKTGQPFSGVEPNSGKTYQGGREVTPPPGQRFLPGTTTPIDPNNVSQRYQAVDVAKNPGVAAATGNMLDTFKKTADASLQDFSNYKARFQDASKAAFDKGNAATDLTGYEADTRGQQGRYSGALDAAAGNAGQANAAAAAREQAALAEMRATLPMYDTASQNAANLQLDQLNNRVSRYKLAKGGGLGLGSDEMAIQAAGARAIQVPVELAKIQARQNIAQNVELPIIQQDAARSGQFYQNFMPGVAASQYNSASAVSNAIQQLRMHTAGMSYQNALQYMQSVGVPEQIQQQILGQQLGNLGSINSLESGSRYQGLQDRLGVDVSQPVGYAPATGGLPVPRYPDANIPFVPSQPTQTGTGGFPQPQYSADDIRRINASRYVPVNSQKYMQSNSVGPYDTASGYADYNQPFDYSSRIPERQIQ